MNEFEADEIVIPDDCGLSHGEGWLSFQWPDTVYGREGLSIDLDGHCSRNMPIRSGNGPPKFVDLQRSSIKLRFDLELAKKLMLDEEIEIAFDISDDEFVQLRKVVDYFDS